MQSTINPLPEGERGACCALQHIANTDGRQLALTSRLQTDGPGAPYRNGVCSLTRSQAVRMHAKPEDEAGRRARNLKSRPQTGRQAPGFWHRSTTLSKHGVNRAYVHRPQLLIITERKTRAFPHQLFVECSTMLGCSETECPRGRPRLLAGSTNPARLITWLEELEVQARL